MTKKTGGKPLAKKIKTAPKTQPQHCPNTVAMEKGGGRTSDFSADELEVLRDLAAERR